MSTRGRAIMTAEWHQSGTDEDPLPFYCKRYMYFQSFANLSQSSEVVYENITFLSLLNIVHQPQSTLKSPKMCLFILGHQLSYGTLAIACNTVQSLFSRLFVQNITCAPSIICTPLIMLIPPIMYVPSIMCTPATSIMHES